MGAAAMLYEVGMYINPVGLHRHAYYIYSRSDCLGLRRCTAIIATVARFQGNSKPQLRDRLIKVLPAQIRSDVIKSIAILRMARALNQGRRAAVHSIRATAAWSHYVHGERRSRWVTWNCGGREGSSYFRRSLAGTGLQTV